jgi:SAM-dependent methyltransferase
MADVADPRVSIQASLQKASNYNSWIVDQAKPYLGSRVLDAGCGAGNLMRLLLDRELVVGVDEWPDFVGITQSAFADAPNVAVVQADLADPTLPQQVVHHAIDSVICANVLEHVEDDRQALANLAAIVPGGGRIFLLVPAFPVLYGEHDRADHHFRRYTKRSLRRTVEGLPLEVERAYYMNLPGFFAWLLYVRVMRRRLSEDGIGLYDHIIPAVRALEARVKPPFGQTLVAILRTDPLEGGG